MATQSNLSIAVPREKKSPPTKQFSSRESRELVLAFSGPLGCGIDQVVPLVAAILEESGYQVTRIKLSEYIETALSKGQVEVKTPVELGEAAARYSRLQDGGNELRRKYRASEILAEQAVKAIAVTRTTDVKEASEEAEELHVPLKRAFLVEQLKHPAEVELLRAVYRNLFFLIGVLSVEARRRERLLEKRISKNEVELLVERDLNEPLEHGQHLDKTLELADFFLRNDRPSIEPLKAQLRRFVDLIHGANGVTPTADEFGMYVAYASSLASACLSRQVGAAIVDQGGHVLGTGCNEVPRAGGGLYSSESGESDARCIVREGQRCWNDWHKARLRDQVAEALRAEGVSDSKATTIAAAVYANSRIKDLIEFSRAVHAEAEAIIAVARKGVQGIVGATLFSTTFPCHSCARHITAAGIRRVVFIQPYQRSLALDLHGDSIVLEPDGGNSEGDSSSRSKVAFVHFEGVAPRRYVTIFQPRAERKQDGKAIALGVSLRQKPVPEYLDSYRTFEKKVLEHLHDLFGADEPLLPDGA